MRATNVEVINIKGVLQGESVFNIILRFIYYQEILLFLLFLTTTKLSSLLPRKKFKE